MALTWSLRLSLVVLPVLLRPSLRRSLGPCYPLAQAFLHVAVRAVSPVVDAAGPSRLRRRVHQVRARTARSKSPVE